MDLLRARVGNLITVRSNVFVVYLTTRHVFDANGDTTDNTVAQRLVVGADDDVFIKRELVILDRSSVPLRVLFRRTLSTHRRLPQG